MSENPFWYEPARAGRNKTLDILQMIVIVLAALVVLWLFVFIPFEVDGSSMESSFFDRELLITDTIKQHIGGNGIATAIGYNYTRGDVVIFQLPDRPDYIKRVIGIPGDEVMIEDGWMFLNGQRMDEPYLDDRNYGKTPTLGFLEEGVPKPVPEGTYFVVGDNRNGSKDSRHPDIGFVERKYIKGKVILRWWPIDTFGIIGRGKFRLVE